MSIDFPVTFAFFGHHVLLHPVLESFGIFLSMRYYYFLKRRSHEKQTLNVSLAILIGATAGALLGSKIIGNLEKPTELFQTNFSFLKFWTNNTIIGGLAFGLFGVELAKKIIGYHKSTGDLIVYPLILAMIIGRVGCFFTGIYEETYGLPTTSVFGIHLGDEYLRHPVALYEMFFLIVLWLFLDRIKKKTYIPSGFYISDFYVQLFHFPADLRFYQTAGSNYLKPKYHSNRVYFDYFILYL